MFKPGGLGRDLGLSIGWGEGAAGAGGPAAAGGGHWLLVGSGPLPEAAISRDTNYAGSALFGLGPEGKKVDQTAAIGFLSNSVQEPGVMCALPVIGCHARV